MIAGWMGVFGQCFSRTKVGWGWGEVGQASAWTRAGEISIFCKDRI